MKQFQRLMLVVVAALAAAACSGSPGTSDTTPTPSLTITPTEWAVPAGGAAKQFTATLKGSGASIAWSIETAGSAAEVGMLAAGLYTPPPSLGVGRDVVWRSR